jgi:hypothetical protein
MWDDDDDDNLHPFRKGEPTYFYRVHEFVTTFEKGRSFSNDTDFRTGSLKECKAEAESFFQKRLDGFESGKAPFYRPFASPANFKHGENAAYSITLSIVEYYDEDEYYEYVLLGDDEDICAESREIEAYALKERE